jgi:DNA-binding SARP family transcriptional activator
VSQVGGDPEVEVGLLGPPLVRGAARPFGRSSGLELVVYLAVHPGGADNDAWATALWPDRLMAPATRYSTASSARRSLGHSRSGHDHLPRSHGFLRLAASVTTDLARLVALGRSDDPVAWDAALGLVRGRPFDRLRCADWAVLEGIAAEVEESVVSLALRVADHHLAAGDGHAAARALRRALPASPYDERLHRRLLRAADAVGNPAGVESAMAHLIRLLGGDGHGRSSDPADLVHPRTAELYRALSRRGHGSPLVRL